jgi:outer membrane protein
MRVIPRHWQETGLNYGRLILFFLMAAFAVGTSAQTEARVGYVNLERILRDAAPAVRAQKKLEQEFAKRDQELGKMADQLKRLQEGLEKNSVTMSESERAKREREFADMNREFQRRQREAREDFNQRRNEELSGVIERANRAVKQIAEAEKFDVILQEVVWASPRIDITDKVIKALDDSKPAK